MQTSPTWESKADELMRVLKSYYCMQIFFDKEQVDPLTEFIFKKKLLPKEDWFAEESLLNLSDFQEMISRNCFKSESEFSHKLIQFLEAFTKIEKRHMGMCI